MIIKKIIYLLFMISLSIQTAVAVDFNAIMEKSPIITITNDEKGNLKSVTVYAIANAPVETVWNTILDINSYKDFMPRIDTAKIISRDDARSEITADFVIDVPFVDMKYRLLYKYDKSAGTIQIKRLSGDLEGSSWLWKFEEKGNKTVIIYSGVIKNYFSLLEKVDDDKSSITVGVTISTLVSTVKMNKERAESLYKSRQGDKSPTVK